MPEYVDIIQSAFVELWAAVMLFLPRLILAIIVFLLGLIVASILRSVVVRIVQTIKLDELMEKLDVKKAFLKAGIKLDVAGFLGWLVKWFVIVLALIATADALGWDQITVFLSDVVAYLPNVIISVIILLVGFILGSFVQNVVKSALDAAKIASAGFLAGISKWAIIVFSFMAVLIQLGIAYQMIMTLFTGFVAMLALAGGLAFGLGGRDHATRVLDKLSRDLKSKE
ncbi:MAG: hypothetical protein Q8P30_03385 [Candidatus Uhrbacteria bacterium]|nr:hypothetical protein [Candidatus Uhrbacteria bacterium]